MQRLETLERAGLRVVCAAAGNRSYAAAAACGTVCTNRIRKNRYMQIPDFTVALRQIDIVLRKYNVLHTRTAGGTGHPAVMLLVCRGLLGAMDGVQVYHTRIFIKRTTPPEDLPNAMTQCAGL